MEPSRPVEIIKIDSESDLVDSLSVEDLIKGREEPVIIRGIDLGPCLTKWTPDYLSSIKGGDRRVKVHRSPHRTLDFRLKNFKYETVTFSELVKNCTGFTEGSNEEYWYLRSLGEDPRGKDVSDLEKHYPELFKDIKIPQLFPPESFFSSVFRITSPGLQLWTHYDTCHNILIQVRGRKRVVFYPPTEALNLYLDGDKSEVLEIDRPDLEIYPKFALARRFEGILEEGDIVFIPSLWFHNITALDFSVSVNVFWKNLPLGLYDKKDTYGNKDLIPAQLGFRTLDKAADQLKNLPHSYEDFYLRRMIISLENRLAKISAAKDSNDPED